MGSDQTTKENAASTRSGERAIPGIVISVVAGKPWYQVLPLHPGTAMVIGRGAGSTLVLDDERMSRQNTEILWDGARFRVRDLGGRNGTKVDGRRITTEHSSSTPCVLALGQTLAFLTLDVGPFGGPHDVFNADAVAGPSTQAVLDLVGDTARDGNHLLLLGESGSGKERIARHYHEHTAFSKGHYEVLNCAALNATLVESELFGYARGAFSGATKDRAGLFEAAHQGTLFLDELAEMTLDAQAKVLRAIQQGEVRRIGENQTRVVDVRLVAGTNADLPARISAGGFRADLYYRLAQSVVRVPPLRDRREEIPFLVRIALREKSQDLPVDVGFYEQCFLRSWPGNVRELLTATTAAARLARKSPTCTLMASHLDAQAGNRLGPAPETETVAATSTPGFARREEKEAAVIEAHRRGIDPATIAVRTGVGISTVYRYIKKLSSPD